MALTVTPAELTATALTLTTAAQPNITSVGTLSALTVSGDLTVDTSTLKVDSSNNNVGIGGAPDSDVKLHVKGDGARIYVDSTDYNLFSIGRRGSSGVDLDKAYLRMKNTGTNTVVIDTAGASYFNGGNVGIGVTSPGAVLSLPAGESNTPRFAIESAVDDNDFTITQYEDGNGTYTMLGQNVKLNSGGNNTVLDSGHRTAGIVLDSRNHGAITFITGAANTATEHVKIDSSGNVGIGTLTPGNNHAKANNLVVGSGSAGGMAIYNGTAEGWYAFSRDNANNTDAYDGGMSYTNRLMKFHTNAGSTRMAIDASGRVLIGGQSSHADGYSTPGGNSGENAHYSKLWVQGNTYSTSGDGRITLSSGTAWPAANVALGQIFFSTSWGGDHAAISCYSGGQVGNTDYPGYLRFDTTADGASSPTERMRIDSDGNLLVGDSSVASASNSACTINSGGRIDTSRAATNLQTHHQFFNPNGVVGTITTTGSATAYNQSSDYRLKENVIAMSGATDRLKQLKPCRFNFIADADTKVDGFLAHEVQDIVPQAITGAKDAVDADGNPEYQGIDQSKLVPLLVATIQELEARLTVLENN